VLTKRVQAERAYADLSASYARALVAEFQARPPATVDHNGRHPAAADPRT